MALMSSLVPPALTVDQSLHRGNPPPSLCPHYRASSLLRGGPPLRSASVLYPLRIRPLGGLPLEVRSTPRAAALTIEAPVHTFRAEARVRLTSPLRRTPPGQETGISQAHPEIVPLLGFDVIASSFDACGVRLPDPYLTSSWPAFCRNAHHPGS